MIDVETKNYFEGVVREIKIGNERTLAEFKKESKENIAYLNGENQRYMLDLKKTFSDEVKLIAEVVSSRPDEGRVREIIHEEIKPLKIDIEIIKREVSSINKNMENFQSEMKLLRKDHNSHGRKLTRLENVLV